MAMDGVTVEKKKKIKKIKMTISIRVSQQFSSKPNKQHTGSRLHTHTHTHSQPTKSSNFTKNRLRLLLGFLKWFSFSCSFLDSRTRTVLQLCVTPCAPAAVA
jgi:hypothetical protein